MSDAVNMAFAGMENTEYEKLEMPQFTRSALLSTGYADNGENFTHYSFNSLKSIPVKSAQIFISGNLEKDDYKFVGYYIYAEIPRDEIIKMAESIK